MLNLIFFTLKVVVIGIAAVFVSQFVKIDGSTLSDHARRIVDRSKQSTITRDVQRWAHQISQPIEKITPQEEDVEEQDKGELKSLLQKQAAKRR